MLSMADLSLSTDKMCAAELDADDELASFRDRFYIPRDGRKPLTYLCGHSLGLMPKHAEDAVQSELDRWRRAAVDGHFSDQDGWLAYHERFAQPLAKLVGARASEVVAMNSLTVNLHLMLVSFYRPTPERHAILIESGAFPSDRYAVESQLSFHGYDVSRSLIEWQPVSGFTGLSSDAFEDVLRSRGGSIALVLLPGVQYVTGEALDIAELTEIARRYGCRIGFDLAHAIGNVPLKIHDAGADFAVWCSYKYLNGGPGAVGGCFVHARHHRVIDMPRFCGWWGHDKASRFRRAQSFRPIESAEGWQISNPPILSMAPLDKSLEIFVAAKPARLRQKSVRLTSYLEYLVDELLRDRVSLLSPRSQRARGAQLSFSISRGRMSASELVEALRREHIVIDSRESDILRIAPVPLYNRFIDVFNAVDALQRAL